jgi:glycerophosphoryl diester phosphodiesterase
VAGRATLAIELKGRFAGDHRVAERAAKVLTGYAGPAAVMSFDPGLIAAMRELAPGLTRGLVGMRRSPNSPTASISAVNYIGQAFAASPQFLAYRVADLTTAAPLIARHLLRRPVLTWTVRTPADRDMAARHADQMIFEGFRP